MKHPPHILLVNPWITDFAAYNLWARPLGLLYIGSILRQAGFRVSLVDCLDFPSKKKTYGDGKFHKVRVEKPLPLKSIPRYYSRYGIPDTLLLEKLSSMERPDVVCVTSEMTYWYPGLFKTIEMIKKLFKEVPVVLGGIYATLCYAHARQYSVADYVISGRGEQATLKLVSELTGFESRTPNGQFENNLYECETDHSSFLSMDSSEFRNPHSEIRNAFYPSFDLYPNLDSVCMATSRGCPFRCSYCASHYLSGGTERRDPLRVADEIEYWTTRYQVKNIAFYDDALLIEPYENIVPTLNEVIRRGIHCNFHAPNGLHIREIDEEVATLLFRMAFQTIRLGLETSNEAAQIETGGKVDNQGFLEAVRNLKKSGYPPEKIGVYIMAGLPGQRAEEVEETIAFVREKGARPILAEYSPTPHTLMFEKAKEVSSFDLEKEPLYHNNSIFPCQWEGFTLSDLMRLKENLKRN